MPPGPAVPYRPPQMSHSSQYGPVPPQGPPSGFPPMPPVSQYGQTQPQLSQPYTNGILPAGRPPMPGPGQTPVGPPGQTPMGAPGQTSMGPSGQTSMVPPLGMPPMPGQQQPQYGSQPQPQPYTNGPMGSSRPPGPGGYGPGTPQQPQQPPMGMPYGTAPQQQQQPQGGTQGRKLDPEQMPSAIGVMQEDQQSRGGAFQTNQRGLLPPLVTTKFSVDDQGNSSPRFIRSTMYSIPAQPDMLKQTSVPFALVVNPFGNPQEDEQPIMCVDLGPMGPVRCIRCKAYMSPLMNFIDGGRRFQCLLCKATTEVPPEYFQHLDHTGQRVDKWERPELWKGSYEFVATVEYCRNNVLPKEPGYIFAIDVSYNNVKNGLVNLICGNLLSLIEALPSHTPVGLITYNSKVHFYNIDPNLAQPQMVIVPDVSDMFMPLLDGFMVPRSEAAAALETLLNQIPAMFGDTKETEGVLGAAIQAGMEALKASERVGKVLVFHSSLPTSELTPGKLKNREGDRKLLGTDKEKAILTPQTTYYNNLAQDCVGNGVSVDLYLFNNSYVDVATIGQVARVTGGSVNKYTYFQAEIDGPRLLGELSIHLGRSTAFDGVMRVRTSTGVRPTDFFGHFYMANTTDVEVASIDSSKSIAVEIKHDDKLTDEDGVYIQVALLYTTIYGQRRLRLHNLALNTCLQMADLYRNCELDTIINFLAKQAISRSIDSSPQNIRDGIIQRSAQMLATYRKHCANPSMPGQLILPECLKLLPLYVNCILRSDAIAGTSELTPDDRSWLMFTVMTMNVETSVHHFYPKLYPIAGPNYDTNENPLPVRCTQEKLREDSAYLLENGIYLFLWIGGSISPTWLNDIFGVSNLGQVHVESITELPGQVTSDECLRLKAFIRKLRTERGRHMRLTVIRQRDKSEITY